MNNELKRIRTQLQSILGDVESLIGESMEEEIKETGTLKPSADDMIKYCINASMKTPFNSDYASTMDGVLAKYGKLTEGQMTALTNVYGAAQKFMKGKR